MYTYFLELEYKYILENILLDAWMDNKQLDVIIEVTGTGNRKWIIVKCSEDNATYIRGKLIELEENTR